MQFCLFLQTKACVILVSFIYYYSIFMFSWLMCFCFFIHVHFYLITCTLSFHLLFKFNIMSALFQLAKVIFNNLNCYYCMKQLKIVCFLFNRCFKQCLNCLNSLNLYFNIYFKHSKWFTNKDRYYNLISEYMHKHKGLVLKEDNSKNSHTHLKLIFKLNLIHFLSWANGKCENS